MNKIIKMNHYIEFKGTIKHLWAIVNERGTMFQVYSEKCPVDWGKLFK